MTDGLSRPPLKTAPFLNKARIIENQALNKRAPEKIYSWHAPEIECIGKGKAHKPYEFGCKATFTTINGKTKAGMFVIHAEALHGNPFDGHTLGWALTETAALTGVVPLRAHVDKGYEGHKQNQWTFDPKTRQSTCPPWWVIMSGRKGLKPHLKKELRRRSAIEPVIGHMKAEHRLGRNFLRHTAGDRFNAKMAAVGFKFMHLDGHSRRPQGRTAANFAFLRDDYVSIAPVEALWKQEAAKSCMPQRRAAGSHHPPRQHPRDERRKLPSHKKPRSKGWLKPPEKSPKVADFYAAFWPVFTPPLTNQGKKPRQEGADVGRHLNRQA